MNFDMTPPQGFVLIPPVSRALLQCWGLGLKFITKLLLLITIIMIILYFFFYLCPWLSQAQWLYKRQYLSIYHLLVTPFWFLMQRGYPKHLKLSMCPQSLKSWVQVGTTRYILSTVLWLICTLISSEQN